MKLKNIKVLVWDVDGTLYQSIPASYLAMKKAFLQRLKRIKGLSFTQAKIIFEKEKRKGGSSTATLEKLGCGTPVEILTEVEKRVDKSSFLSFDSRLVKTFENLNQFRHLTLSNSLKKTTEKTLEALGIRRFFERIIAVEDRGTVKPHPSSFKKVLLHTGLSPGVHLSIGDREEIDIAPAKKLGMKTCFVWGKSKIAHVSIPQIYDIVKVLT